VVVAMVPPYQHYIITGYHYTYLSSYKSFTIPTIIKATPQNLPSNLHTTMEVLTKSMTLIFDAMGYMVPTSFVFSPITTQTELITLCGEIKNQILYFVPLSCHDIILEYFIF
jgi:hypothetical protein